MFQVKSSDQQKEAYGRSMEDAPGFWSEVAENFSWHKKWDTVQSGDFSDLAIKWFAGGKLNITENCLDRHLEKNGDSNAIIWVPNDIAASEVRITYRQLHEKVCQMSNVLKAQGVVKGDRVCFYMGMVPELLIGPLACARIGAIHSIVFGGFSAKALAGRINDCQAKVIVVSDRSWRGDKSVELKEIADEALRECPGVERVLVHRSSNRSCSMVPERDLELNRALAESSRICAAESMDAEDALFILYTSGSTGRPKGLLHTTAGYMVWAAYTFKNVFQYNEGDLFWCTADIGWITGHTYMTYGPLLNGASQVMFEGIPTWPDAGRFWREIERLGVTHFYTAPTAIRALQAQGDQYVKAYDLSSLKVLGTVGEPINDEAHQWYFDLVGKKKCPIVDTWWQTETGGIMISALAGVTPDRATFATLPLPGVCPVLLDEDKKEILAVTAEGALCMKYPWPGVARTIFGDSERYRETYFSQYPGYYFTGDGARRDHGEYRITGRMDDVINVSGHRIGTAEVEDAINQHPEIVESAVVGFPHPVKGQGIFAYVIPLHAEVEITTEHTAEIHRKINEMIVKEIGPIAKADQIKITTGLPKTRSGKIMRRILRKIAAGERQDFGDTSTLLNPEIIAKLL